MTRDQMRARHAYLRVGQVPEDQRGEYKVAVNDLGTNIMRSGLTATMAFLERQRTRDAVGQLLGDLADALTDARIPGLTGSAHENLPARIRGLGLDEYMLVTREMLKVALWFRRAVQATFPD